MLVFFWKPSLHLFPARVDENRHHLDDVGLPQIIVALLEAYAESISPELTVPMPLSVADLKVVKTAIGVLLNASVNYGSYLHTSIMG
jgi:hypothetical protein